MNSIFSSIQHYFASVVTAVTATLLVIFPFAKPQVQQTPTPTPISIQEVKGISTSPTPVTEVKKTNPTPLAPTPTPTPTPTPLPNPTATPPVNPIYQPPQIQPSKKDYSYYKFALQNTLNSLKSRLANVQSSADQIPQNAANQRTAIESRLESDLARLEYEYKNEAGIITADYGRRGIPISSGMVQSQLNALGATYDAAGNNLIAKAEQDKQKVIDDATNQIYQADAQDKDLSNKISLVEGLINKINSESFTDSDIPIAIQAMSY